MKLDLVGRLDVEALRTNKHAVDIHTEVLARVSKRQKLKELRVI